MNPALAAMETLNLTVSNGMPGTIEQDDVLKILTELEDNDPENADLFQAAADKLRLSRSAGEERIDADSVFSARRSNTHIVLRYRGDVTDILTDLAIDLAMRGPAPVEVAAPNLEEV